MTINFFSTDYNVDEEEGFVTIEMTIRETQIPFTLTLTPTTVDDVLADTRLSATHYLTETFSTVSEAGEATPGDGPRNCTVTLLCICSNAFLLHVTVAIITVICAYAWQMCT